MEDRRAVLKGAFPAHVLPAPQKRLDPASATTSRPLAHGASVARPSGLRVHTLGLRTGLASATCSPRAWRLDVCGCVFTCWLTQQLCHASAGIRASYHTTKRIMPVTARILFACCLIAGALNAGAAAPVELMPDVSEVQWGQAIERRGQWRSWCCRTRPRRRNEKPRGCSAFMWNGVSAKSGQPRPPPTLPPGAKLRVYLGQAKTFPTLNRLCDAQKLAVPEHQEGYALKVWADGGGVTAVVAGVNGRAVIYGQDTLFQLLGKQDGQAHHPGRHHSRLADHPPARPAPPALPVFPQTRELRLHHVVADQLHRPAGWHLRLRAGR